MRGGRETISGTVIYEGIYIGGHAGHGSEARGRIILNQDHVYIEALGEKIPYYRIKKLEIMDKERISKLRLLTIGLLAFAWKKHDKYLMIIYEDDIGMEQRPTFNFSNYMEDSAQTQIYLRVVEAKKSQKR